MIQDQPGASSRPERQVPTEDTKPFQKQDPYEEGQLFFSRLNHQRLTSVIHVIESAAQQSLLNVKEEPHEPVVNFVTKKGLTAGNKRYDTIILIIP